MTAKASCPAELVCLTFEEAATATEDALRHAALIDWVSAQTAIETAP